MSSESDDIKDLSTEVFFKDSFEIDDYLSKCTQKSDLLTLRSNLKHYGQELYGNMIDILKFETDNIVNLAEDLTNLSIKIDELAVPVAQLKEEVRSLYLAINTSELDFEQQLDIANTLSTKRDLLNLRMAITSSLKYIRKIIESWNSDQDLTILERAVNEYSFQYLYSSELGIDEIVKEQFITNIASELIELVHVVFLKGLSSNESDITARCLSMYANLDKQKEAENFVKEKIVRPALLKVFTQRCLDEHNNNMKELYMNSITILNTDLITLCTVLDRNPNIKGFNFVVNSFWIEVDKQLRENLPNITAPGNPEFFQTRYRHTEEFIEQIIAAAKTPNLFETDPSFEAHMKRFNLPVYYEIRFQQIAAKFEAELLMDPTASEDTVVPRDSNFMLNIGATLWNSIERCLHKEVYLVPLSDQLFKLVMLLISRYITWYETVVQWPNTIDDPICNRLEKFVMYSLADIVSLKQLIGFSEPTFDGENRTIKFVPPLMQPALADIFRISNDLFETLVTKLQQGIVTFKIEQCAVLLQQVSAIPRIYRRTNRGIPSECSSYVTEAVILLTNFYDTYNIEIHKQTATILDVIIAGVSDRYIELVQEVLRSVCKTEESLKRLKNRNANPTDDSIGQSKSEGMSDETKIREQIKLDVSYFVQKVKEFSHHTSKHHLKKLLKESDVSDENGIVLQ